MLVGGARVPRAEATGVFDSYGDSVAAPANICRTRMVRPGVESGGTIRGPRWRTRLRRSHRGGPGGGSGVSGGWWRRCALFLYPRWVSNSVRALVEALDRVGFHPQGYTSGKGREYPE